MKSMQLTEITYQEQPPVDAYGPGFFRVEERVHEGGIFLSAAGLVSWVGYDNLDAILTQKDSFDILFVGTGADIGPLPTEIRNQFDEAGIAAEVMASPSACRTYNILLSEGRRVALAAIPV